MSNEDEEIDPRYPTGYSPERLPIVRAREAERARLFEEMLNAAKLKWINPLFTPERFPVSRERYRAEGLYDVATDKGEKLSGISKWLAGNRLRPAGFEELLAYAAKVVQSGLGVRGLVALGAKCTDPEMEGLAPCLYYDHGRYRLTIVSADAKGVWSPNLFALLAAHTG